MKKYAIIAVLLATVAVAEGFASPAVAVPGGGCSPTPNVVRGSADDDVLVGTNCADVFYAYAGDDIIYGLGGNDVINAGPGDDDLYGGTGTDTLKGQAGDDDFPDLSGSDTRDHVDDVEYIVTW